MLGSTAAMDIEIAPSLDHSVDGVMDSDMGVHGHDLKPMLRWQRCARSSNKCSVAYRSHKLVRCPECAAPRSLSIHIHMPFNVR